MNMETTISTKDHFYNISLLRLIATLSILVCHIFQFYNNFLAWWLNVGVVVFLIISGYLYGLREYTFISIKEKFDFSLKFYYKVFVKLLIPYYLLLILMLPVYLAIGKITFIQILKLMWFINDGIKGFGGIWYLKVIALCYLITPIYYFIPEKSWKSILLLFAIILILPFSSGNRIFYVCFFYGILSARMRKLQKIRIIFDTTTIVLGLLFTILCIYFKIDRTIWSVKLNIQKLFLGAGISTIFIILNKLNFNNLLKEFLNISDSLSYEVFLIHPFFISGALCIMTLINISWLNILIMLLLVFLWASILHFSSGRLIKFLRSLPKQ